MAMTNKEFCKRLRKAKWLACVYYIDTGSVFSILDACNKVDLEIGQKAVFDLGGKYEQDSCVWVCEQAKSYKDIMRVFDESIRALGEEP